MSFYITKRGVQRWLIILDWSSSRLPKGKESMRRMREENFTKEFCTVKSPQRKVWSIFGKHRHALFSLGIRYKVTGESPPSCCTSHKLEGEIAVVVGRGEKREKTK